MATALSEALDVVAGRDWSGSTGSIIPCLVFNAAMIPGWPPPRPFDMPSAEAVVARTISSLPDEAALAFRLAERGGAAFGRGLALLPRRLSRRRRRRLLLAVSAMMDVIEAVLSAVEQELLDVSRRAIDDHADVESASLRRQLTA